MRKFRTVFLFMLVVVLACNKPIQSKVVLKSGEVIVGIIKEENNDFVELYVGDDILKYSKKEILHIEKSK